MKFVIYLQASGNHLWHMGSTQPNVNGSALNHWYLNCVTWGFHRRPWWAQQAHFVSNWKCNCFFYFPLHLCT